MGANFVVPLQRGQSANIWELGPIVSGDLPGWPAPAEDRVNYVFRNGFTGVGDLPVRNLFRNEMVGRTIPLPPAWISAAYYIPVRNRRVEFNDFCYCPTHRRRWCRTVLTAPAAGEYRFSLGTCGGVRIWVDGVEQARFEPFVRNVEQRTEIALTLKKADNSILVHMEEVFERDTYWGFDLKYLGEPELAMQISAKADASVIATLRATSASIHPQFDVYVRQRLTLVSDVVALHDIAVNVRIVTNSHDHSTIFDGDLVLAAGQASLDLGASEELAEGYHNVLLTFRIGDVTVERMLGIAILNSITPASPGGDEASRKQEALAYAARHGDPRIGRLLAMLATGFEDSVALESILDDTLGAIERREDCSDFSMVPLLSVWGNYADKLPAKLRARTRNAILGWRYWVDEPGNDVMWFWSENHVLCFHVSQHIAGKLFPNDIFTCSGRTGAEQVELAAARLGLWFDSVETHGFVEWNSAAYYPIDFIGLFGLYQWSEGELKARTCGLLDRLFVMTGLHTRDGVPAGSQGRAYDKELRAGPLTELAPFCTVAFGQGWLNTSVAALPLYCLSDYEAPVLARQAALWQQDGGLSASYTQGHDHNGKLVLYKDRAAMLSCVVDHNSGAKGSQQHVLDVRLAGHPMARLWVNHPGEDDPWGVGRPSYWTGNGILPKLAQLGHTALMIYDLGEKPEIGFVHVYAPASGFDERATKGHWLFVRSGDGYAGVWSSVPMTPVSEGNTAGYEFRGYGHRTGWAVRVGSGEGASGFAQFQAKCLAMTPSFDAATLFLAAGDLALDWQNGASISGQEAGFSALSVEPQIHWGVN